MRKVVIGYTVAALLLILSFMMYRSGWIVLGNATQRLIMADGIDRTISEVENTSISDLSEIQEVLGTDIDARKMVKDTASLLRKIRDGKISPPELVYIMRFANRYSGAALRAEGLDASVSPAYSKINEALQLIRIVSWVGLIFNLITILTFLLAVYLMVRGRGLASLPYFICIAIWFVFFLILLIGYSDSWNQYASYLSGLGVSIPETGGLNIGIPSVLSLIFAIASSVVWGLSARWAYEQGRELPDLVSLVRRLISRGAAAIPASRQAPAKICPNCGTRMESGDRFCLGCGREYTAPEPVPQDRYCMHCGKKIGPRAQFCPYCGEQQKI